MAKNRYEEKIRNLYKVTNFTRGIPKNYSFEEIGPYLNFLREKNTDLEIELEQGVNIKKEFITPQRSNSDLSSRIKVRTGQFVYCTQLNNENVAIAYREGPDCVVSPVYEVFEIKPEFKNRLLPYYLLLWLMLPEFGRYVYWAAGGSAYEFLRFENIYTYQIIIPPIEEQQKVVNAWKALREIKEQNEAIAAPLMQVCQSYIQELKHKYESVEIGPMLEFYRERNKDLEIKLEQGININKEFITPQRSNSDLSSRVKVRRGQFAYCTQLNNENVAIAYRTGPDCVVSPVYEVFEIKQESKKDLLPEYLLLWLIRAEFGRYVYWTSVGSAYEFLRFDNLYHYRIPLPPIDVQQSIVNLYNCANEAKKIAEEADKKSREICPALIQYVIYK